VRNVTTNLGMNSVENRRDGREKSFPSSGCYEASCGYGICFHHSGGVGGNIGGLTPKKVPCENFHIAVHS
jgi:hypothetical protein